MTISFIFAVLKINKQHIAFLFALLLGIIQLPFNAFHTHATDEHFIVKNSHSDNNHHCEIEDLFCETGFDHHCEHGMHVKSQPPDCFTCEFNFIKLFIGSVQSKPSTTFYTTYFNCLTLAGQVLAFSVSNATRGPPLLLF